MNMDVDAGQVVSYILNLVFLAWPLLLLSPLRLERHKLRAVALLWVFLAVIRPVYAVSNVPKFDFIIGEPLYTALFSLTGFVILVLWAVNKWPRRKGEGRPTNDEEV